MRIVEIGQSNQVGKRYIKLVAHEIHNNPSKWNKNGISWNEQYVEKNKASSIGMPIVAQFLDDEMEKPFGHGEMQVIDNQVIFEDSVVVGTVFNSFIDDVIIQGETIRAFVLEAWIYEQRYPLFVNWIFKRITQGESVETSVEICATEGNKTIIYEDGYKDEGRIPMEYVYTGQAILSIPPSDDKAIILELNNKKELEKLDKDKQELEEKMKQKEEENAALKKQLEELNEFKKKAEADKLKAELNSKLTEYNEDEKAVVKDKIESFSANPTVEAMNEILHEVNAAIVKKVLEERKNMKVSEQNSMYNKDVIGEMYQVETNFSSLY